jgi:hypothetical protein
MCGSSHLVGGRQESEGGGFSRPPDDAAHPTRRLLDSRQGVRAVEHALLCHLNKLIAHFGDPVSDRVKRRRSASGR